MQAPLIVARQRGWRSVRTPTAERRTLTAQRSDPDSTACTPWQSARNRRAILATRSRWRTTGDQSLDQIEARRYRVLSVLGAGGFGKVYRARLEGPEGFEKEVAIKLLHDPDAP